MRSTVQLTVASVALFGPDAYTLQPAGLRAAPLPQCAQPLAQFGTSNYERTKIKGTFLSPIPPTSPKYEYGKKKPNPVKLPGGIEFLEPFGLDPRLRLVPVLGLAFAGALAFPLLIIGGVGTGVTKTQSPFKFLDFIYPPILFEKAQQGKPEADKKAADAKAAEVKAKAAEAKAKEAEKKAKADKAKAAKAAADTKAKAKEADKKKDPKKVEAEARAAAEAKAAKAAAEKKAKEAEAAAAAKIQAAIDEKQRVIDEAKAARKQQLYEASPEYRRASSSCMRP